MTEETFTGDDAGAMADAFIKISLGRKLQYRSTANGQAPWRDVDTLSQVTLSAATTFRLKPLEPADLPAVYVRLEGGRLSDRGLYASRVEAERALQNRPNITVVKYVAATDEQ